MFSFTRFFACTLVAAGSASAALIDTRTDVDGLGATVDGSLGANEYGTGNTYSYTGGGIGFGGPLGAGTLYLNSDLANLYLGFTLGAALNDDIVIYLDTKPGGFDDSTMSDTGDGGRGVVTNLGAAGNESFPGGVLPDYAILFGGGFNMVLFELTGGSLNFITTSGNNSGLFREGSFSLSSIGVAPGGNIDFFAAMSSETNFLSNESLPATPMNGGANPGQASTGSYENHDRFAVVPEPSALLMLVAGGGLLGLRRRR